MSYLLMPLTSKILAVSLRTARFNIQKFFTVLATVVESVYIAVRTDFINWLVFITVVEIVYSAVRTDSLYKVDYIWSLINRGGKCLQRGTDWFLI